jgi:hypothetical protein
VASLSSCLTEVRTRKRGYGKQRIESNESGGSAKSIVWLRLSPVYAFKQSHEKDAKLKLQAKQERAKTYGNAGAAY